MRTKVRQTLVLVAIYAVALQTVLAAFLPPVGVYAGIDPLTVICHSAGPGGADPAGRAPQSLPADCGHCILCGAPPAAMPHVLAAGASPVPRNEALPYPPSKSAPPVAHGQINLARGPPSTT